MNAQGVTPSVAVLVGRVTLTLAETARQLGISPRHAQRLMADGRFPVPPLPRMGREPWRFSAHSIDRYVRRAS